MTNGVKLDKTDKGYATCSDDETVIKSVLHTVLGKLSNIEGLKYFI